MIATCINNISSKNIYHRERDPHRMPLFFFFLFFSRCAAIVCRRDDEQKTIRTKCRDGMKTLKWHIQPRRDTLSSMCCNVLLWYRAAAKHSLFGRQFGHKPLVKWFVRIDRSHFIAILVLMAAVLRARFYSPSRYRLCQQLTPNDNDWRSSYIAKLKEKKGRKYSFFLQSIKLYSHFPFISINLVIKLS